MGRERDRWREVEETTAKLRECQGSVGRDASEQMCSLEVVMLKRLFSR